MRGEPNAIGISTKKLPEKSDKAYKSDAELEENKRIITEDINKAIAEWNTGNYNKLVIPQMGVGLAELPTRAPKTYKFLQQELERLEKHVSQNTNKYVELSESDKFDLGAYIINMQTMNNGDMSITISRWLDALNKSEKDLSKGSFNNMLDQVLTNKLIKRDGKDVIEYAREIANEWFANNKPEDIQNDEDEAPKLLLESTDIPNLFTYDDKNVSDSYYVDMVNRHSDVTFVIDAPQKEVVNNFKGTVKGQSNFGKLANSMTIAIPTDLNQKGDALRDLPGTSYDKYKTIIENKIININQKLKLGKPVAISTQGFGDPYRMPQELFVYLSKRLFESFGYINPGSVMDTTETNEDDVDKEILEALGLESNIFKC